MPVGTFYVDGAFVLDAQTIRLTYIADALDFSPFGLRDALNPNHYVATVLSYPGGPIGLAAPPDPGVLKVTRVDGSVVSFDAHVNRPLELGVTYRLTVANVEGETGDPLGFPDFADVAGVFRTPRTSQARPLPGDFAVDMRTGRVVLSASGDIAVFGSQEALRDRMLKRVVLGNLYHLPTYGVGLSPKNRLIRTASLVELRNEVLSQLREEADLQSPSVTLEARGAGILFVDMRGTAAFGGPVRSARAFAVS